MNYDEVKGKWNEVKDKLRVRWNKLTEDDLKRVEGRHDELGSVLQHRYDLSKEKADSDSKAFFVGLGAVAGTRTPTSGNKPKPPAPGTQLVTPAPVKQPGTPAPATQPDRSKA